MRALALVADDEDLMAVALGPFDELERAGERARLEDAMAVGVGLEALPAPVVAVRSDQRALDRVLAFRASARKPAALARQPREQRVVAHERVVEIDADAHGHSKTMYE